MVAVDWSAVATTCVSALLGSVIAATVFYVAARTLFFEVMSHPGVQAMIRLALKYGKGGGGIGGKILGAIGKALKGVTEGPE